MIKKPSVLFITSRDADYLQDAIYGGLVQELGLQNVTEVPFNKNFHHEFRPYPRNLGLQPEGVLARGLMGFKKLHYDLVIVGAAKPDVFETYKKWLPKISSSTPVVFIDGGDRPELGGDLAREGSPHLYREVTGLRPFDWIFKREYLHTDTHPSHVRPLPFAINPKLLPAKTNEPKKYDVTFWAVESDPVRSQALQLIEDRFDCRANGTTRKQVFKKYKRKGLFYLEELTRAKITLNFRGVGWDTLRYWEVPALSRFLLSQRPQIQIPNNFREGKEIIFCKDDLSDLVELCEYYLKNDEAREQIARAAGEWSLRYHTPQARAREVLSAVFGKL